MSDTRKHKAMVSTVGGDVFIALPDDQYIELTPEKARKLGALLFFKAAEALGEQRPSVIVFEDKQ